MASKSWPQLFLIVALTVSLSAGGLLAHGAVAQEEGTQALDPTAPGAVLADLGDSITYQGRLMHDGSPIDGTRTFGFKLFDAPTGGNQVGDSVWLTDVPVSDGYLTVELDFGDQGDVFNGQALWLDITLMVSTLPVTLTPRQPVTAAPYAHSLRPGALVRSTTGTALAVTTTAPAGAALYANATATTGLSAGVMSFSHSPTGWAGMFTNYGGGTGVYGLANAESGEAYGVRAESKSLDGAGLYATAPMTAVVGFAGEYGYAIGVYGSSNNDLGRGVRGDGSVGVYGRGEGGFGSMGVFGVATEYTQNFGVYGAANWNYGYAVYSDGNLHVSADLTVMGSKAFKIDHPLDPAHQYLYHFAQEAPQAQNVYNGVVTLDETGEALVTLPAYFDAINTGDFRYQLTPIGAPMPNLYIAAKIQDGAFRIAGGAPGKEVSWEVTAIRNDPYLRDHSIQAEQDKPEWEQGTYLYPEGYGQPEEMGLDYQNNPERHAP